MKTSIFTLPLILAATLVSQATAQQKGSVALLCNGSTDYIASNTLLPVANDFIMEAMVNPTKPHEIDPQSSSGIAGCSGEHYAIYPLHGTACWGPGHAGAGFSVGTNGVSVYEHAGDYMPAVLVYEGAISGWTHVAVVYHDGVPSLFINGKLVKRGVHGSQKYVHPSAGRQAEGRWIYGGIGGGPWGYFAGEIDNVTIWGSEASSESADAAPEVVSVGGRELLASFDMERSGAGSGLRLENRLPKSGVYATTAGTATTPIFVPYQPLIRDRMPVRTESGSGPVLDSRHAGQSRQADEEESLKPTIK